MQKLKNTLARLARNRFGAAALFVSLTVSVVFVLRLRAESVAGAWFDRNLWDPVAKFWNDAAARQMGDGGTVLLIMIVALVACAVYDEAKTVSALRDWWNGRATAPKKLSWEERQEINKVRQFWNLYGKDCVHSLGQLGNEVRSSLERINYLAPSALDPLLSGLAAKEKAMDAAVADNSSVGLGEVHARLDDTIEAYRTLIRMFMAVHERDMDIRAVQWRFAEWGPAHQKMKPELTRLHEDPAHRGRFKPIPNFKEVDELFPIKEVRTADDAELGELHALTKAMLKGPDPKAM